MVELVVPWVELGPGAAHWRGVPRAPSVAALERSEYPALNLFRAVGLDKIGGHFCCLSIMKGLPMRRALVPFIGGVILVLVLQVIKVVFGQSLLDDHVWLIAVVAFFVFLIVSVVAHKWSNVRGAQ